MEKKQYMSPSVTVVKVVVENHLLDASSVGFSENEYGGGSHRSRKDSGSIWDDDDEE